MSEIDPRPIEPHLLKICERIIRLDYDDSETNTKHLNNICKFLFEEMGENDEIFKELFQSVVPAGSYPDDLKISEPDEYDLLMVLKFPDAVVSSSRPGYVTINISEALRNGWNDYAVFVDDDGYLIQNKVLDWIRGVVRKTLQEHNNVIETDECSYEVNQSSNGPAVTLDVTALHTENIHFSIDFVGCLAFNSDEWWTSDVSRCTGVWNAIPKPIKQSENMALLQLTQASENVVKEGPYKDIVSENKNKKSEKVRRPPSCFQYKNRESKVIENVEKLAVDPPNRNTRPKNWYRPAKKPISETKNVEKLAVHPPNRYTQPRNWYRRAKRPASETKEEKPIFEAEVNCTNTQKSRWEKSTVMGKESTSDNGSRRRKYIPWCRKTKKTKVEDTDEETVNIRNANSQKPLNNKSVNSKDNTTKNARIIKQKKPAVSEAKIIIPNPQKNREWICSYAEIERQLLKGTDNMKPLIRIFKKIRDKKQLTNLKSYYIKTIFLHHNSKMGSGHWKQSLAVLFMEMFDVILAHLCEHRLDFLWHPDFNLFRGFRSGQIISIYEQWLKMKNDIISNLENDNPEFIYEVICTEDERLLLEQSDSESEVD